MLYVAFKRIETLEDAVGLLQMAIGLEFGTLPPYLYALYSIAPGTNDVATVRIKDVVMEEMVHMCLACNVLNALGTNPTLTAPTYPGPLPGNISGGGKEPLIIHLHPFSKDAMAQAMSIEEPEGGAIDFPHERAFAAAEPTFMTIGQFYNHLDDSQFLFGELFAVNGYDDAHRAIQRIVSEGEGTKESPLDFLGDVAHYYRFAEIFYNQVLTKSDNPKGFAWKGELGVDWKGVYPAIADPGSHDFSRDPPAARAAQDRCDAAYTRLVQELQRAVAGETGRLGNAVRAMFDLRMAAQHALTVPLADPSRVAGPSFRFRPELTVEGSS